MPITLLVIEGLNILVYFFCFIESLTITMSRFTNKSTTTPSTSTTTLSDMESLTTNTGMVNLFVLICLNIHTIYTYIYSESTLLSYVLSIHF